jgi:hypothetical protein
MDNGNKAVAYIVETFHNDPAGYCKGVLGFTPDPWQKDVMESVRDNRRTAVRACHGPGKTFTAACIVHWFMSTKSFPRIRCTANTEKQIMSVLWSELSKVNRDAVNQFMFLWSKTKFELVDAPEVHWAQALAWSENNSEAFAGIHEENVLYVFDEASAIADIIWEVSQGAMTTKGARWLALGNPTRNTGKFHECFGKNKWKAGDTSTSLWHSFTISADMSPRVTDEYVEEIAREYGVDSDPYRIRVLGLPPVQEEMQFIGKDLVDKGVYSPGGSALHNPKILSVDVARFGDDRSVGITRKGFESTVTFHVNGQDTMQIVGRVLEAIKAERRTNEPYDYILIDVVGVGAGVYDRLNEIKPQEKLIQVNAGSKPYDKKKYFNMRANLWGLMKDWLVAGGKIDPILEDDLLAPQYSFNTSGQLVLERKKDIKKRGLGSPDFGDALAYSFYVQQQIKPTEKRYVRSRSKVPKLK